MKECLKLVNIWWRRERYRVWCLPTHSPCRNYSMLCMSAPAASLVVLWACDLDIWPFDPQTVAFILVQKCINAESLVKFSRYHINKAKMCILRHGCSIPPWPWTLTFRPKTWNVHSSPKMHQCWQFDDQRYVQHFPRYCVNNVRNARTDGRTW